MLGENKMRIGLDIDNVVSDFDKKVEYECAIEDRRKRNRGMVNPDADWIPRFYDWSYDEVEGFFEENMEEFAKVLELREGALEYMTKLMEEGHELYLISHRVYPHYTEPLKVTKTWLLEKKVPYTKLILSETVNKTKECKENNVDVMFDDSVTNCRLLIEGGVKCYVMGTKYTHQVKCDDLDIVYNWKELYELINKLSAEM